MKLRKVVDDDDVGQDFEWLGYSVAGRQMNDGHTWIIAGSPAYRLCALYNIHHFLT